MTDKEQALIAAAYRVAAERFEGEIFDRQNPYDNALHYVAESLRKLTPSDAEAKLRALMMEVAWAVLGSCILEGTENFQGAEKIVDEVLNGHN